MSVQPQVYDAFIYNGEIDILLLRLAELDPVVDVFVLVEGNCTFSGLEKSYSYPDAWSKLRPYWHKLRLVHVTDWPETSDPWVRERHQRDAVLRGCLDAAPHDWIIVSDVDEIPRRNIVQQMINKCKSKCFGFRLSFRYFALNYANTVGPESNIIWNYAVRYGDIKENSANKLRYSIKNGEFEAEIIDDGGWHFSYIADKKTIINKIKSFSHQELNKKEFIDGIDIKQIIREGRDLFSRGGFKWELLEDDDYPVPIQNNRSEYAHLFASSDGAMGQIGGLGARIHSWVAKTLNPFARSKVPELPVIICPYLHDKDRVRIEEKFQLSSPENRIVPVHFWQDKERIGPERAFETCWSCFPGRDVVILHTDMEPMPDQSALGWYHALGAYRETLQDAGMIACNLLFPTKDNEGRNLIQCAGGRLENGTISHFAGQPYPSGFDHIREVAWVTFGGVLLRRRMIDCCGSFDRRYRWAYVMDVDYSLEARLRGFKLYQVPQTLLHHENGTTSEFLADPRYRDLMLGNFTEFQRKWNENAAFPALNCLPAGGVPGLV